MKRKPIRINPKMRGVFTRKAKKKNMTVQQYAKYIIKKYKGKTKNKKQLKLLRQAVFVKTAKKWKKRTKKHKKH
jgi:phosphotransferase system HPr-like phosphotransfer protein